MKAKMVPNEMMFSEVLSVIKTGATAVIRPKGISMHPFIRDERDCIALARPYDLRKYDIVLVHLENGSYVLHRIIEVDGENLTLMGDGNLCGRERCRKEDVVAKAIKIIKKDSEIDCRSASHLRKARLWKTLLPIRRYLLAIYRRLYK